MYGLKMATFTATSLLSKEIAHFAHPRNVWADYSNTTEFPKSVDK